MSETIQSEFEYFHLKNPKVFEAILMLTRKAYEMGMKRYSMKFVFEKLRYEISVAPNGLRNDFTSRYARLVRKYDPKLGSLYKIKSLMRD